MKFFGSLGAILNAWTGSVAGAVIAGLNRIVSPRVVRLIEGDDGRFAVEAAGKADNIPARIAFADGAASRQPRRGGQGQPGRDRAAAEALPVSSAGTAGARGRLHRGHRARADRSPDAVERERGGVRLHRAQCQRRREHHHDDRRDHAQGGDGICAGAVRVPPVRGRDPAPMSRSDAGARAGVRAKRARIAGCGEAEPHAAARAWRRSRRRGRVACGLDLDREQPRRAGGRAGAPDFGAPRRHPRRLRRRRPLAGGRCSNAANTRRRPA